MHSVEFGRGDDIAVGKVFFVGFFFPLMIIQKYFCGINLNLLPVSFMREVKASFHSSGWKWGYAARLGISMHLADTSDR